MGGDDDDGESCDHVEESCSVLAVELAVVAVAQAL